MDYIRLIDNDIDHELLCEQVTGLLNQYQLHDEPQISLTSISGDNDWYCTVGKLHQLPHPERFYANINRALHDSYIAELLNRYKDYYRWRLLRIESRSCYSIHSDRNAGDKLNVRLHIPVETNHKAFMCFFQERPQSGKDILVRHEHLEAGNSYKVNTTGLHTAINYGDTCRYHIVGVKYENSNNWNN